MVNRNTSKPREIRITFFPSGKRGWFPKGGVTILDAARTLGTDLASLCGGIGACGKCKVRITKGVEKLNPLTEQERKYLTTNEVKRNFRLACQVHPNSSIEVCIPERSRIGKLRLQTDGFEVPVKRIDPLVKKFFVELPVPDLKDPRSDEDRLIAALHEKYQLPTNIQIDFDVALDLASILREGAWKVTATVWKNKIIDIEEGDTSDRCFGFACDIGTTKLAGFLIDLSNGRVVALGSRMNPQVYLCEEVMGRITHQIMRGCDGIRELQKLVVQGINEIIVECCRKAEVNENEICEFCFVGNTAMQLCFLGIYGRYLAYAPYPPVLRRGVDVRAKKLGLKSHPRANSYFVPVIGGFVGADNVAVILATRMLESDEMSMALDIGTNTEIALGNKDRILVDSCASGPAFEGMHIKYGMRAIDGSIERVSIDPQTFKVNYRTIENKPAIGICGSALIDLPAELLKAGLIDFGGRLVAKMADETDRLRKGHNGLWEFVVAWQRETATDIDITITQKDIREIQKAKAAIRTGSSILMKRMGITENDISHLYVAGAFGNYIDPKNARTIGLYPEIQLDKIEFVGNIAGTGSRMCLISKEERDYAEHISTKVEYHELAADKDFQTEFINATFFPHKDLSKYPETVELLKKLGHFEK
jgi:uncharacterized 2Fe-2S/4Fe-4S cluster protein (DUF4445 family)